MTARVVVGDCLNVMPTMALSSIDSIVTDPPYGLAFMGMAWDRGVPGAPFWEAALGVAKPGAYLVAFGGTRTFHRLTCAIEDAGWEIRDCLSWLYGSGFPKSHNGPWGGTALKPGWEPIILARKPFPSTVAANVLKHSTGALNIDACRISTDGEDMGDPRRFLASDASLHDGWQRPHKADTEKMAGRADARFDRTASLGRWPANVALDEEAAALLDEQSGAVGGGTPREGGTPTSFAMSSGRTHDDFGGASRFFYTAKASRSERDAGLDGFTPVRRSDVREKDIENGYQRTNQRTNHHPTVKPLDLMQWLCRLVTPRGGLVLDPFTGSGTTGRAAVAEGFGFVGIELNPEYAEIARARITEYAPLFSGGDAP